jgi:hypothetical protein
MIRKMAKRAVYLAVIAVIGAFAGCGYSGINSNSVSDSRAEANRTVPEANIPFPRAPRISLAEAKADFDAGTAVFIDTHSPATYETEHVAGSINVPATELAANIDKIPKGKKLIAYCS